MGSCDACTRPRTEVRYWLWDARAEQVMRCFMVPRGSTLIAGGHRGTGREHLLDERGTRLLSNDTWLTARTVTYEATVTVGGDTSTYDAQ